MSVADAKPSKLGLVLAACCVGQFLMVLDAAAINVALWEIAKALNFDQSGLQWVVSSYTIVLTGFLLLGGRAADLFGRRRTFLAGIAIFTLASLIAGLAVNQLTLVIARGLVGLGAAIMVPATLTILGTTFTDPKRRAKAFGWWAAVGGGGGAVGALIGGAVTGMLGWRWVELINVPIGLFLLLIAWRSVTEKKSEGQGKLDWAGAVSVTLGLIALVYGITQSRASGWGSAEVIAALVIGVALLAFFVLDQAKLASQPLVPLSIFRNRSVSAANGASLFASGALGSTFFFATLLMMGVLHIDPFMVGLSYLPLALSIFVASSGIAPLVPKLGPRPLLLLGLAMSAGGLAWLAQANENSTFVAHLLGPTTLLGLGEGIVIMAATYAGTAGLPWQQQGLASGLINTTRQLGVALGLAVIVAITSVHTDRLIASGSSETSAQASGYSLAFLILAGIAVLGFICALFVPGKAKAAAPPIETKERELVGTH
ncbi:MAG TPA: MFS transporter [Micromonosporaceae bacterium]|nr:MFS transporter [Micromonosporaceae bacterium]